MIGGVVIETVVLPEKIWVNCEETQSTSKCAIYVERNETSERIKPSDSVWWQGGWAMWTPYENIHRAVGPGALKALRVGKDYDIKIPRIGCSGVAKPTNNT